VLFVLLYLRGGLATVVFRVRDAVVGWVTGQRIDEVRASANQQGAHRQHLPATVERRVGDDLVLEARDIVVRYGGNVVLDRVSLHLRAGEVLGILGPNGAGKTTLFDVLSGHVKPKAGAVLLGGADVTGLQPEQRAGLGLGRTFQQARLFDELTLFESLQVALECTARTETVPALLGLPPARDLERGQRRRVAELVELLGLEPYANRPMTALSTGTRRMAELAAVVAMGARVVLLDEPTAGIAQAEVERFTPVIREIAEHLDASVVVIEHDIPLMMGLVDRLYVLAAGEVIAEGQPEQVGSDPAVIAAYLGTDPRVVRRSGVDHGRRRQRPLVASPGTVS
jgi:ABC-type branched-subunit amino acid transport system ATPase component